MTARRRRRRPAATAEASEAFSLVAGRITACFGIKGELKCETTRAARPLFILGAELRYEKPPRSGFVRLTAVREHQRELVISLDGVGDRNAAHAFVGATLYVAPGMISLAPHEYLDADLVGCTVASLDGTAYGVVERIEHYPSSDMLLVAGTMVPMVDAIVLEIDLAERRILIDPPDGLFAS